MSNTLINKKKCKQALLECAQDTKAHPFTRVAENALIHLESVMRKEIKRIVQVQPSAGRTIRMD
jgi:hypothetical protein